jgi:hypothetical protein
MKPGINLELRRTYPAGHGLHVIDGERVTYPQIAARLGINERQAQSRMKRERAKPGPVTWEGLGRGKV